MRFSELLENVKTLKKHDTETVLDLLPSVKTLKKVSWLRNCIIKKKKKKSQVTKLDKLPTPFVL